MLRKIGMAAMLSGGLALTSLTGTAAAGEAPEPRAWKCSTDKYTEDGDAGGSSGKVNRSWNGSSAANAGAKFEARDELVKVVNTTSVKADVWLYQRLSNGTETIIYHGSGGEGDMWTKDLNRPEGQRVFLVVRVEDRGSCTSDTFTT